MASEDFYAYRKQLPHWRQLGRTYFVTWRQHKNRADLSPEERRLVAQSLLHFHRQRYDLWAYVVMNDHVHVLVQPREPYELQQVVHSWKSFTAHAIQDLSGSTGAVWQDEYFDRIVRNDDEFREKATYILGNPRKRWPEVEAYPWVWFAQE